MLGIVSSTSLISCNDNQKTAYVKEEITKKDYVVGESFSSSGLVIYDSTLQEEVKDYTLSILDGYIFETPSSIELKFSKNGYKEIVVATINVSEQVNLLEVSSLPSKVNYSVGESFSSSGLIIKDKNSKEVISNFTLSIEEGFKFSEKKNFLLKASLKDYQDLEICTITVDEKSLFIISKPTKLDYEVGDRFLVDGLKVIDNISKEEVLDYSISLVNNSLLSVIEKKTIIISKDSYISTSFDINVTAKQGIGSTKDISIYSINDTHGAFNRDASNNYPGMAYLGDYFNKLKQNDSNSIIVSCGDMWQGGVESNKTKGFIMTDAMNLSNFDAMIIGNHEFDWGVDAIIANKNRMTFPLLSCNILNADDNSLASFLAPSTIIDKGGLKIGIIGSAQENMGSSILQSISSKFNFPTPNEYIKQESDKLRQLGCDLIILGTHDSGFNTYNGESGPTKFYDLTKNSTVSNARYVDGMLFAHDHTKKFGRYEDVIFAEAGSSGKYVASLKYTFTKTNNGYSLTSSVVSEPMWSFTNCTTDKQEILSLIDQYKDQIGDINRVIYNFTKSYTKNEFTLIACQAIAWFINNNQSIYKEKVYLASHNYAGIRANINNGPFTYADLVEVCPFDNVLAIMKSTKTQVSILNRNTSIGTYELETPVYDNNGYTAIGTISYVAEGYASIRDSFEEFGPTTIKDVMESYLTSASCPKL